MALPALVLVLAAGLWAITVVAAQLACVDAARAGARAAARGEPLEAVRAAATKVAPPAANASVEQESGLFKVEVSAVVRPNWARVLPPITVSATAFSPGESTLAGALDGPPVTPVGEGRAADAANTGPASEATVEPQGPQGGDGPGDTAS